VDKEEITVKLNRELESIGLNQLNELGNRAIEMGLIAGHGHRQGQYEILRGGQALMMTADEAMAYLKELMGEEDRSNEDNLES